MSKVFVVLGIVSLLCAAHALVMSFKARSRAERIFLSVALGVFFFQALVFFDVASQ